MGLVSSFALVGGTAMMAACTVEVPPAPAPAPDAGPSLVPTATTPPAPPPPAEQADAAPPGDAGHDASTSTMSYCELRTTKCNLTAAACNDELTCFASLRPGAGAAIQACVLAKGSCNQVDDCIEAEALKNESAAGPKAFRAACLSKHASCGASIGIDDDDCINLLVFPDATLTTMQGCLAKPCAEVGACIGAELTKAGCE